MSSNWRQFEVLLPLQFNDGGAGLIFAPLGESGTYPAPNVLAAVTSARRWADGHPIFARFAQG